jgi:flavin reductase (DIM6/NTAB) family NADH-FMN oxidoreductase RutF
MKQQYSLNDILNFEQRYRTSFINSLGGFKSLALIGSVDMDKKTNLAVFNSFFHLGASPPLFGFTIRPDSVDRHTLNNILVTHEFTVNHVLENFYKQAHQTSARYPENVSEFDATQLTAEYRDGFKAPFVKESSIQIGAEFLRKIDVIENGTILIIAKIRSVAIPQNCIAKDGFIDIEKAGTITCQGLDSYHTTTRIARLSYAKPDITTQEIKTENK